MTALTGLAALGSAIVAGVVVEPMASAGYQRHGLNGTVSPTDDITLSASMTFGPAIVSWGPLTVLAVLASDGVTILRTVALPSLTVPIGGYLIVPAGTYPSVPIGLGPAPQVLVADSLPVTIAGDPVIQDI